MRLQRLSLLIPYRIRGPLGLYLAKNLTRIPLVGIPLTRTVWPIGKMKIYKGDLVINNMIMLRSSMPAYLNIYIDRVYDTYGEPKDGDVVIDVGACTGLYAVKASKLIGPSGKVIAIEPSPEVLPYLRANAYRNSNIVVVERALSDRDGEQKFFLSGMHGGFTPYKTVKTVVTTTTTLDKLVNELKLTRVDYIKTNTAFSMNTEVLKGATGTLKKWHPQVVVYAPYEIQGRRSGLMEITSFFYTLGYETVATKGICIFALRRR